MPSTSDTVAKLKICTHFPLLDSQNFTFLDTYGAVIYIGRLTSKAGHGMDVNVEEVLILQDCPLRLSCAELLGQILHLHLA